MEIDSETLVDTYRAKPDEELLSLHANGTLTNHAYEVLEAELGRRGIPLPQRPDPLDIGVEPKPQSLRDHWQGRAALASAYWLLGVLGGLVVAFVGNIFVTFVVAPLPGHLIRLFLVLVTLFLQLAYFTFVLVSVWRCAWNTSWKGWGYIARFVMVINVLIVASYYVPLLRMI